MGWRQRVNARCGYAGDSVIADVIPLVTVNAVDPREQDRVCRLVHHQPEASAQSLYVVPDTLRLEAVIDGQCGVMHIVVRQRTDDPRRQVHGREHRSDSTDYLWEVGVGVPLVGTQLAHCHLQYLEQAVCGEGRHLVEVNVVHQTQR